MCDHLADFTAGCAGVKPLDERIRNQMHVWVLEFWIHAQHLGVGLGKEQAGKPIARVAADALAALGIGLVQHHAERRMERTQVQAGEIFTQLLNAWLVADGRMQIGSACLRLGGVLAADAVDMVVVLGLRVIGLQVSIADGPFR